MFLRIYCRPQGTLLTALWSPKWEGNPKKRGFPGSSYAKEFARNGNARDLGSIPGLGRSTGEGKGYPLQYSGLENSKNSTVHGVAKSQTVLSDFHFQYLIDSGIQVSWRSEELWLWWLDGLKAPGRWGMRKDSPDISITWVFQELSVTFFSSSQRKGRLWVAETANCSSLKSL